MSSRLDEFKKPIEEWARGLADGKPTKNLLIRYKLLYALGAGSAESIFEIDRLCIAAMKGKNTLVIRLGCLVSGADGSPMASRTTSPRLNSKKDP